jgi:hypothetical protein
VVGAGYTHVSIEAGRRRRNGLVPYPPWAPSKRKGKRAGTRAHHQSRPRKHGSSKRAGAPVDPGQVGDEVARLLSLGLLRRRDSANLLHHA